MDPQMYIFLLEIFNLSPPPPYTWATRIKCNVMATIASMNSVATFIAKQPLANPLYLANDKPYNDNQQNP